MEDAMVRWTDFFLRIIIVIFALLVLALLIFIKYKKKGAVIVVIILMLLYSIGACLAIKDMFFTKYDMIWVDSIYEKNHEFLYTIKHNLIARDGKYYTFSIKLKPEDFFEELQADFDEISISDNEAIIMYGKGFFSIVYEKRDIHGYRYTLRSVEKE
jgi:hypothetical protein